MCVCVFFFFGLCAVYADPILVPLTNSLYVPGELGDIEKVIVDVGTGYMIEKVRVSDTRCITF